LMKKLPSCLLGAILAAGIASTTMVNAVDGDPPGLFELEGNVPDDPAVSGDDWGGLYLGTAAENNLITFTGITEDPAPTSIYWKGGSKDINDVTEWWYKDGSVPDKDDITNAYAAAYNNPADVCVDGDEKAVDCDDPSAVGGPVHEAGDLIIYFGLDRYANDGDAFAGFWFFQDAVATNGNNQFTGQHVPRRPDPNDPSKTLPGDVLVLVEYPQASGAVPVIKVYEWVSSGGDVATNLDLLITETNAECDGLGGKLACAKSNLEQQDSPPWPYTPKSGSGLPFESFFEGGINVTQLLGSTPCFAAFLAETRASRSETATLKDFVIDEFPVCGIDVEKDCAADVNTTGDGVEVTFFGSLTNTGGSSFIALLKDDQSGSTIDRVCVDTLVEGCADDPDVAGLVLQGDGSAYFPLAAGAVVRYEGSYSVSGLPAIPEEGFALNDEVTAEAYSDVDDVGNPALVIIDDSDTAGCNYNVNPSLLVTKDCELFFLDGDHVDVTISGTVENTGDVPLSNVTVVDNKFGAITFPGTLAVGSGPMDFTKTQSVSYASLGKTFDGPDANGVVTVNLTHEDEVMAEGDVLASDGTTVLASAEHSDTASCPGSFTTGIDVQKDCEVALDFDEVTGKIVVRVDVTATVTNLGSEDLTGLSLTDDPLLDDAFMVGGAAVPTSLAAGGSFIATGSYFPGTTSGGGTNPNPGLASFTDTVDVSASGAFSALSASDENTAVCDLCPPVD